jgi:hypothetical protein
VFLLLTLGAIVNVAVAWGPLIWAEWPSSSTPRQLPDSESQRLWRRYGLGIKQDSAQSFDALESWFMNAVVVLYNVPSVSLPTNTPSTTSYLVSEMHAGWPCRSMCGGFSGVLGTTNTWTMHDVLEPACPIPLQVNKKVALPLRPVWPGFAVNSLFNATILGLMFFIPLGMRRHRRTTRRLCLRCAYPIGTSDVCTECGAPLPHRDKEVTPCGSA